MKFEDKIKTLVGKKVLIEYGDRRSGETWVTQGVLKSIEDGCVVLQGNLAEIILNGNVCYIIYVEVF